MISQQPAYASQVPAAAAHDRSVNESYEENNSVVSQGGSRLLRDSYDSGSSTMLGRHSLPLLQQQMQRQYKSPQVSLESGLYPSI